MIFLILITLQSQDILSPSSVEHEIEIYKSKLSENPKEALKDLKTLRDKSSKVDTITFKKETGISPSHFIKELKDSKK